MDSSLAAQEDYILHSLDYTLPKLASYVSQREEVVYVPSGAVFARMACDSCEFQLPQAAS